MSDGERCSVCHSRFRAEDAIGTLDGEIVHARCLPKTPRFTDAELEEDDDDPVNA